MSKHLHIVSFDVPFPPNYGGVIDVYYKIKALHKLGVKIHLHCFYKDNAKTLELHNYCESINYYKRNSSLKSLGSKLPFVVATRASNKLIENLEKDNHPILFEGLHCTHPLSNEAIAKRKTFVRTHNVEHDYYKGLAQSETNLFKKLFFKREAIKLKSYQNILDKTSKVLSLSPFEYNYFKSIFKHTLYIPVFHQNTEVRKLSPNGDFALYIGDLRISDNKKAVTFLISVFKDLNYPLIIASSFNSPAIVKQIRAFKNIKFQKILTSADADALLANAHINVILTFQKTGIKLKLINTLFGGRFCVTNNLMVEDSGLESLCLVADSQVDFKKAVKHCINNTFDTKECDKRSMFLKEFNVIDSAQKIVDLF